MVHCFQRSRDRWRDHAKTYHEQIRELKVRIRDVEASRAHWRTKYFEQRRTDAEEREGGTPVREPPGAELPLPVRSTAGLAGPEPAPSEPVIARYEVGQADGQVVEWELLGPTRSGEGTAPAPVPTGERARGHHYSLESWPWL